MLDETLNKILLVCYVHFLPIACYEMFWSVVCGFYSVVLSTITVPLNNVLCVAAFANVLYNLFDCVFVIR